MVIIAIGGRIASGKSTVARELSFRLRAPRVSFGDAVRKEAARNGLTTDRPTLQKLGDKLISCGWDEFCSLVLAEIPLSTKLLIVDGVRHVGAVHSLKNIADRDRNVVVFVEATWEQRIRRSMDRGVGPDELAAADSHPTEGEVQSIRLLADINVLNEGNLGDVIGSLLLDLEVLGIEPGRE